jgi:hypothetical protein
MKFHADATAEGRGDGSAERPFGSLHDAVDAVKAHLTHHPGEPVDVELAGGTYYLSQPLVLDPSCSGSADAPVTIAAAPGAMPVISGGCKLDCRWDEWKNGVLTCILPDRVDDRSFSQLYANGERQVLARFPNGNSRFPGPQGYLPASGADRWPHTEVYYDPHAFTTRQWTNVDRGILHIFPRNRWGNTQYRLRGLDTGRNALLLGEGGWQLNRSEPATGVGTGSGYFVENLLEELDAPGEWYYDISTRRLYWYPDEHTDAQTACMEISILPHIIELVGGRDNPVHSLRLRGLHFAHSERTFLFPYEIPSRGDWAVYRGGAVKISGAEDIVVQECSFRGLGGNGVFVDGYAREVVVTGCAFSDIGDSAVCMVGESHLNLAGKSRCRQCGHEHAWSWNAPSNNYPRECRVSDNVIHDIGVFGKQVAGIFLSLSARITVSHNHIYNTPRAAVCINDGMYGGHVVEFNDIHDTVRETGDHGPFNSWGREPYWCHAQSHGSESHEAGDVSSYAHEVTVIRHNRFRDEAGWGIDLDDGSSRYHVYGNLCIGVSVKLREGIERLVTNNIFYKPANPPSFHRGYEGNEDRFCNNIIVMDSDIDVPETDVDFQKGGSRGALYDIIAPPENGPWLAQIDRNLLSNDTGVFRALVHYSRGGPARTVELDLDSWRRAGFDSESVFADPGFADPEMGDFSLPQESPAWGIGFIAFPLDTFGPRAAIDDEEVSE